MNVQKLIIIIAGPNGAGKTTFFQNAIADRMPGLVFINADEIAADLCPENPESVAVKAGRLMLAQIAKRVEAGDSFVLETTLSGRAYARAIPAWRAAGYEVVLYFLTIADPEQSIARVAARVQQGGHHIPENVIRRRFDKGLENFYTLYRDLVDHWFLYDNSDQPPHLLASGTGTN